MNSNKNILYVTSRVPYPPIGGDKLRSYNLLKILHKHFDVHLVTLTDETVDSETHKFIENHTKSYRIFHKSKIRCYLNILKSLYNMLPLQINYYFFKDVKEYIQKIINNMDISFCSLIRTARYIEDLDINKVIDITDSIAINYNNSKTKVSSLFWKILYNFESRRLLKYEQRIVNNFDISLFVNPEELNQFNGKSYLLQCGIDSNLLFHVYELDSNYKTSVSFLGKMNYQPNIDAVKWFCKNVLVKLNKSINFLIVGAYPTREVRDLEKKYKNVKVTGYVEDPYTIIASSLCFIAPMQTGAGIQNKILEAMALGAITITSSLSSKALIGIKDKEEIFIEDDPKVISTLINGIYLHPKKYTKIKQNAKDFIKRNYTWDRIESILLTLLNRKYT